VRPYSPDLNPMEEAFSKVEALLRRAAARTCEAPIEMLRRALDAVTGSDARVHARVAVRAGVVCRYGFLELVLGAVGGSGDCDLGRGLVPGPAPLGSWFLGVARPARSLVNDLGLVLGRYPERDRAARLGRVGGRCVARRRLVSDGVLTTTLPRSPMSLPIFRAALFVPHCF